MPTIRVDSEPQGYVVGSKIHIRIQLDGAPDARWRHLYNDLTTEAGLDASIMGDEQSSVLVVRLDPQVTPQVAADLLNEAEALLFTANELFEEVVDLETKARQIASTWSFSRKNDPRRFPGVRPRKS